MKSLPKSRQSPGLKLNRAKTSLLLDGNDGVAVATLAQRLDIAHSSLPLCYLGLLLNMFKLRDTECAALRDTIRGSLSSWTARHLSFTGRLQLIKSVIYSVRNF
ncbi:PREDICTED: uncharacterized protein LOC104827482 [Tarenaya hassleriana]|uniref:uncharacterized protein LOC104827482 n=1 Tax=Tarenaya hassleriana TaxID=28532 RepID=UPI00053C8026|nr:PREDICTED: uncharacterized protein LOC104827482 [Tarenaya hassleriana]